MIKNFFLTKNYFKQLYGEEDLLYQISDLFGNLLPVRTKLVWGLDYFRTEPKTFGTILNDGPNGYDNNSNNIFWNIDII